MDRDDRWWREDPHDGRTQPPVDGSGEFLLALLAPVDDLDVCWIDRLRGCGEAVRVIVAYEPPVGLFPYLPRSEHAEVDEAARALAMLEHTARSLPAGDPSDVSSWCALTPAEFSEEIEAAGASSTRLVMSWPSRRGLSEVALHARAWWLARRFVRDVHRPAYLAPYGREPVAA